MSAQTFSTPALSGVPLGAQAERSRQGRSTLLSELLLGVRDDLGGWPFAVVEASYSGVSR